ncbi:hypothetical protein [Paramagnetospirillum magneticum]|nr:hypothetical protein [Paramagnetospirillum magneticum]
MSAFTLGFLIIATASAWAAIDYRQWGRPMLAAVIVGAALMIGG